MTHCVRNSICDSRIREAKVDNGINLLSARKIFVSFLGKPLDRVPSCLCFTAVVHNFI